MDEISRMEKILRGDPIEPVSRLEIFCAMAAGTWNGDPLTPVSRLEYFLSQISGGGGGETKSTLILKPSWYPGQLDYSNESEQKLSAPEGIVYDNVWNSDEYCSGLATFARTCVKNGSLIASNFAGFVNLETFIGGPNCSSIAQNVFYNLTKLKAVVLFRDGVVSLTNTNAFNGSGMAGGHEGGTIYVPQAHIAAYEASTNWATIIGYANNQIKAIEGSVWE